MKHLRESRKNFTRGYSLVEFVIVLGVAGLILGAVWGVAGMMRNNVKQERFSELLNSVATNIRGNYSGKAYFETTLVSTMMPILTSMNVFPSDTVRSVSGASVADSPFGEYTNPTASASPYKSLYVCGWRATTSSSCDLTSGTANVPLFAIEVLVPAGGVCITTVMKNSNPATLPGLVDVSINGYTVVGYTAVVTNPKTLPVTMSLASAKCAGSSSTIIPVDFVFRLLPLSGS